MNIKKALSAMKQEISEMEVDIGKLLIRSLNKCTNLHIFLKAIYCNLLGVMQHTLMHTNLIQAKPESTTQDSMKFASMVYVK